MAWQVPEYWTKVYPNKYAQPQQVGGDYISGATFTMYADYIFGVTGDISHKEYCSKSTQNPLTSQPTIAVEYDTIKDFIYRKEPAPYQGQLWQLSMWDAGNNANKFESTVVWTDGTNTYYFPSGVQGAPVYTKADDVISVFSSFGWGILVVDRTNASFRHLQLVPNVLNPDNTIKTQFQWPTYNTPPGKPASFNLYQ